MVDRFVSVVAPDSVKLGKCLNDYSGYSVVGYQVNQVSGWHYVVLQRDAVYDENKLLHRRVNELALQMQRGVSLLMDLNLDSIPVGERKVIIQALGELTGEKTQ